MELAQRGRTPFLVNPDGSYSQINLHHSKQNAQGPLFELSRDTHQGNFSSNALHPHLPNAHPDHPVNREQFDVDRAQYWMDRAAEEQQRRNNLNQNSTGCGM